MTIEHKNIPDAELHEPKGVSTAQAGEVYVANGSGSGAWRDISKFKAVEVTSESDFPAPIGGVSTLEDGTIYTVRGAVNMASTSLLVPTGSAVVIEGGSSLQDSLTYVGTSPFIQSTNSSMTLRTLVVSTPNAEAVRWDSSPQAGRNAVIDGCVFESCLKAGQFTNSQFVVIRDTVFNNITSSGGISLFGAVDTFSLASSTVSNYAGNFIDIVGADLSIFTLRDCRFSSVAGNHILSARPDSANFLNLGEFGSVRDNVLLGDAAEPIGALPRDIRWQFEGNNLYLDSTAYGLARFSGNTVTTPLTQDLYASPVGTPALASISSRVELSGNAVRYIGEKPVGVIARAALSFEKVGGSEIDVEVAIFINGIIDPDSEIVVKVDNDGRYVQTQSPAVLVTGDEVEVRVRNITDSDDIIVSALQLSIEEE